MRVDKSSSKISSLFSNLALDTQRNQAKYGVIRRGRDYCVVKDVYINLGGSFNDEACVKFTCMTQRERNSEKNVHTLVFD